MSPLKASIALAVLGVLLLVVGVVHPPAQSSNASGGGDRPASHGGGDRPETGLQGQTTFEDVISGRSQEPYYKGARLVGHTDISNRGANWQMAYVDDCAYVATLKTRILVPNSQMPLSLREPAGVAVIDVSNPRNPKPVRLLRDRGSIDAVETMHAVDAGDRKVLVAGNFQGSPESTGTVDAPWIDIYDVSDCKNPKLMSSVEWPENAHNITLSPNGRRVYGTVVFNNSGGVLVLDISDMAHPRFIGNFGATRPDGSTTWFRPHEVSLSADERRVYAAVLSAEVGNVDTAAGGVVYILDNTDIVEGRANPQMRLVGEAVGGGWHSAWPANINGVPHLVGAPELGVCPGTWPRIIDISDERNPRIVGEFKLEMNRAENCGKTELGDRETIDIGHIASHYADVDDAQDTRLGVFGFTAGGLRIADLTDPTNPVEVAYYKPGANPGTSLNARGIHWSKFYYNDQAVDACGSHVRYVKETGHIWFSCQSSGFHVIELTSEVREQVGLPPLRPKRR